MGAMAGVELHKKIIRNTVVTDIASHFLVVHITNDKIYPWMEFEDDDHPGDRASETGINISKFAKSMKHKLTIGAPCNTFHNSKVFDRYQNGLLEYDRENNKPDGPGKIVKISHIINNTVEHVIKTGYKKVAIMGTTITRTEKLYSAPLKKNGITVLEHP